MKTSGRNGFAIVGLAYGTACTLLAVGFLAAIGLGYIRVFYSESGSMEPTLPKRHQFIAERFSYLLSDPKRADLVVFRGDNIVGANSGDSVKRVVGIPGDVLTRSAGRICVNGNPLANWTPPIAPNDRVTTRKNDGEVCVVRENEEYIVPPENFFLLGDNPESSLDSRYFGAVPRQAIVAKVCFIFR